MLDVPAAMSPTIAIIADDLTGALDSAAPFVDRGLSVAAALDPGALELALGAGVEVVAVNTLTRHLEPAAAAAIAGQTAALCVAAGAGLLLKKIDSRLRGQVGAEAAAIAGVLGAGRLVVAPAVPAQGRIVTGAVIRGAGVAAEGIDVRARLAAAASLAVEIPDSDGAAALDAIAASCIARAGAVLAVGAHGLASALARRLGRSTASGPAFVPRPPVLVVVGSQDPATAAQVAALAGAATIVDAPGGLLPPPPAEPLAPITVLRSAPGADAADAAAGRFAAGASAWATALRPRTLLATGGDTAASLLGHRGCRVLDVGGEAAPGIPWSRLADGAVLVTKSGGFGGRTALLDLLRPAAEAMGG
jgi:uncharacterized protein YgbK (DUF1537 family)